MGKINGCLKCLFIFFNVLYAIIGCFLIFGVVKLTSLSYQMLGYGLPGVGWLWLFAISVLSLSCLGIYAGCTEKVIALKIFTGFMAFGMVITLVLGIVVVVARNQVKEVLESSPPGQSHPLMLDEGMRMMLDSLQSTAHCCGLVSTSDWEMNIPQSCQCNQFRQRCKPKPLGTTGPAQIYVQTCNMIVFSWLDVIFKISMSFFFGCAVTALLGMMISALMIYQVKRHDGGGVSMVMKSY